MRIASLLTGSVIVFGLAAAAATASIAAPQLPQLTSGQSLAQPIHWRAHRWGGGWGYCRNWRHECAERWGWGSWRFQRCLRIHGC